MGDVYRGLKLLTTKKDTLSLLQDDEKKILHGSTTVEFLESRLPFRVKKIPGRNTEFAESRTGDLGVACRTKAKKVAQKARTTFEDYYLAIAFFFCMKKESIDFVHRECTAAEDRQ